MRAMSTSRYRVSGMGTISVSTADGVPSAAGHAPMRPGVTGTDRPPFRTRPVAPDPSGRTPVTARRGTGPGRRRGAIAPVSTAGSRVAGPCPGTSGGAMRHALPSAPASDMSSDTGKGRWRSRSAASAGSWPPPAWPWRTRTTVSAAPSRMNGDRPGPDPVRNPEITRLTFAPEYGFIEVSNCIPKRARETNSHSTYLQMRIFARFHEMAAEGVEALNGISAGHRIARGRCSLPPVLPQVGAL